MDSSTFNGRPVHVQVVLWLCHTRVPVWINLQGYIGGGGGGGVNFFH